jgi:hypothetical protein
MVHLTEESGCVFVDGILSAAEAFFKAEFVDLEGENGPSTNKHGGIDKPTPARNEVKQNTCDNNKLEKSLQILNSGIIKRKESDNLVFSRIREELDTISNSKKEDRLIITGLTSTLPQPNSFDEKKKWLTEIVTNLLNRLDPEFANNILFINQGKNHGKEIPMVEVRLKSKELAKKARMSFVTKLKQGEDFGRVHMANSVCLATRVRVDIMKAIAKQFGNQNEAMYVSAYNSRPVLHIKKEGDEAQQRPFAMTFADAIERFGARIEQEGLTEAYKRVGRAFHGQLEQHFVVLKDNPQAIPICPAPESAGQAKKRPWEDQNSAFGRGNEGRRGRGARGGRGDWKSKMPKHK